MKLFLKNKQHALSISNWLYRLIREVASLEEMSISPQKWQASNFSLQNKTWNTHQGQENNENDHQLKILIVKQILLVITLWKCLENSMENMHSDVRWNLAEVQLLSSYIICGRVLWTSCCFFCFCFLFFTRKISLFLHIKRRIKYEIKTCTLFYLGHPFCIGL